MPAGSIEGPPAGYSLQDVAAALGVSVNTLRKQIRAGQVRAERVERPQGLRPGNKNTSTASQPSGHLADDPPVQEAPNRLQQPAKEMMQAEAMAAYMRSLLEPWAALVEQQETVIRDQARDDRQAGCRAGTCRVHHRHVESPAWVSRTPCELNTSTAFAAPAGPLAVVGVLGVVVTVTTMVVPLVWPR